MFLNILFSLLINANEVQTNAVNFKNAPKWLKRTRIEKVTTKMQRELEWSIRRIPVIYYSSNKSFLSQHKFGSLAVAVTKYNNGKAVIHLGPQVKDINFDQVFGHELVHVILYQKYKKAIPKWLEEGLANHLTNKKGIDYKVLKTNLSKIDVYKLAHPFGSHSKASASDVRLRYMASQAFAEMLDKKCDLENLIRLSVGRNMEDYLKTYCELKDLNAEFKKWVLSQYKSN